MALHPALGGIDVLGEDRLGDAGVGAVDLLRRLLQRRREL